MDPEFKLREIDAMKRNFYYLRFQPIMIRLGFNFKVLSFWNDEMNQKFVDFRDNLELPKFLDLPEEVSERKLLHENNFKNFQTMREFVSSVDAGLTDIMGEENKKEFEKIVVGIFGGDNFSEMTDVQKLLYSDHTLELYH